MPITVSTPALCWWAVTEQNVWLCRHSKLYAQRHIAACNVSLCGQKFEQIKLK